MYQVKCQKSTHTLTLLTGLLTSWFSSFDRLRLTAPTLEVLWDLRVEAISEVFMFWRFLGSGQRDRISMDLAKDFHLVKKHLVDWTRSLWDWRCWCSCRVSSWLRRCESRKLCNLFICQVMCYEIVFAALSCTDLFEVTLVRMRWKLTQNQVWIFAGREPRKTKTNL